MKRQCSTCGGSMAHYASVPPGYCVTHSEWFTSFNKCSSNLSSNCSTVFEDEEEFGYVCPIDGTRISAKLELSERGRISDIINQNHPEIDTGDLAWGLGSDRADDVWNQHISVCEKCKQSYTTPEESTPSATLNTEEEDPEAPSTPLTPKTVNIPGEGNVIPNAAGTGWAKPASVQKTAMWYYLKPRWIIRRKVQAAVRRKVRSLLTPIAIKSSSVQDEE